MLILYVRLFIGFYLLYKIMEYFYNFVFFVNVINASLVVALLVNHILILTYLYTLYAICYWIIYIFYYFVYIGILDCFVILIYVVLFIFDCYYNIIFFCLFD